jgi:hypothetical protein
MWEQNSFIATHQPEQKMTIDKITIKMFGTKGTIYRVLDSDGEVVQVFESLADAVAFIG